MVLGLRAWSFMCSPDKNRRKNSKAFLVFYHKAYFKNPARFEKLDENLRFFV
jgi:hypothetical protein